MRFKVQRSIIRRPAAVYILEGEGDDPIVRARGDRDGGWERLAGRPTE